MFSPCYFHVIISIGILEKLWLIIGKKCVGTRILTLLKSVIEESHNVYIDKLTYNGSFIVHSFLLKCCLVTIAFSS